jgi:probable F420-dependent oxidoreductase
VARWRSYHPRVKIGRIGRVGIWSGALRRGERGAVREAAAAIDELGYGAMWFPGGPPDGFAERVADMLTSSRKAVVASGIVSVWTHQAERVAALHHAWQTAHPGRFLLGLGISHQHLVEQSGITYTRPLNKLRSYLDELDAASPPVPVDERILASLGPRSLEMARERSLGTHPYFMPVAHTRLAREAVGPGKMVATELMVVLDTRPDAARAMARQNMANYLGSANYARNLLRLGYAQADLEKGGSDRIVDDLVAWGDEEKIRQRVAEHLAAGADHVCIQVLTSHRDTPAVAEWQRLAPALV